MTQQWVNIPARLPVITLIFSHPREPHVPKLDRAEIVCISAPRAVTGQRAFGMGRLPFICGKNTRHMGTPRPAPAPDRPLWVPCHILVDVGH